MGQRPDSLPEGNPAGKPKPRPRKKGGLTPVAVLLIGIVLGGVTVFAVASPFMTDFFGIRATESALGQRATALDTTAQALEAGQQALQQQAIQNQQTQVALDNSEVLLGQTATQGVRNVYATQTAIAVSNVQQQTQIALNYEGTQAALNRQATQVELDFQATRSAMNQNATAVSVNATQASIGPTSVAPITSSSLSVVEDTFASGLDESVWTTSPGRWQPVNEGGMVATAPDAWLKTPLNGASRYRVTMTFTSVQGRSGSYDLLLMHQADSNGMVVIRLEASEVGWNRLVIYRATPDATAVGMGLYAGYSLTEVLAQPLTLPSTQVELTAEMQGTNLSVQFNMLTPVNLSFTEVVSGYIGIQFPAGGRLDRIFIEPL